MSQGTAPPSVHLRSARLTYGGVRLFDGLDLDLPSGQWISLLGPSGVGKTTVLRMVAGLVQPEPPTTMAAGDSTPLAGRIAWMGQQDLLLPWLSVRDNVTLGDRLRGTRTDAAGMARASRLLQRVGLADEATARPAALSGGMRQRVALARTLYEDRPLVLMDEPFSAVDAITRLRLQDLAAELLAGRTVLLVTHDPLEALRLSDRVLVLSGRPVRLSPPLLPPGPAPRAVDDPGLLALQGQLLARLAAAEVGS
ncbi:ABC transporter ATP-binding protein [Oleisolibacter albus]|uniref:ABC transporter ATP-binding protein n=1 Tax=Oleisolibacter albus TaxID=2171757 RepID=UPI000DF194F6|nr:ABC transporter ATP-binding protein [Oleisolibacter albus]